MKTLALLLIGLGACTTESNLGNTVTGRPDGNPGPGWQAPDAEPPYVPDAYPPHNDTAWFVSEQVTPDQACDPWNVDNTATTAPVLGSAELTLHAANGEHIAYSQSGALLMQFPPAKVELQATVRLIDGAADYRITYNGWGYGLTITDGTVTTRTGTTISTPTTATEHGYEMKLDPVTGWVIVTIDGNVVAEEFAANVGQGAAREIDFGQLAPGTSAWTSVYHNVHATTDCVP